MKKNKILFNKSSCNISSHAEKIVLLEKLSKIFSIISDGTKNISELLEKLSEIDIINDIYLEELKNDEEAQKVFDIQICEVVHVLEYLQEPKVSTQHGVKGESHESVVFVASDSNNTPVVHMYKFFEVWHSINITLNTFNDFYYGYVSELSELQNSISMKINDLKKDTFTQHEIIICSKINEIIKKFQDNIYFKALCAAQYEKFISKSNVTNAKDCLKESTVYGVLSAYKLFYVGCSRARKNLTILIDRSKIKGDIEK